VAEHWRLPQWRVLAMLAIAERLGDSANAADLDYTVRLARALLT